MKLITGTVQCHQERHYMDDAGQFEIIKVYAIRQGLFQAYLGRRYGLLFLLSQNWV